MINGNSSIVNDKLKEGFEAGFIKASRAFSQLVNNKVWCDDFQYGDQHVEGLSLAESYQRYSKIPRYLLTTEIFGDVAGKCYLYLSQEDFAFLTRNMSDGKKGDIDLREEFIKELDNILSAAVVTQLSNTLNRKMFGDVPVLVGKVNSKLEDVIYDDFNDQAKVVNINSIYFSFDGVENVSPLFIWVFDSVEVGQYTKKEVNRQ